MNLEIEPRDHSKLDPVQLEYSIKCPTVGCNIPIVSSEKPIPDKLYNRIKGITCSKCKPTPQDQLNFIDSINSNPTIKKSYCSAFAKTYYEGN